MISLRNVKSRIRSVENTWKLTRAMQMISVSKLRRSEDILIAMRKYFQRLDYLLKNLCAQKTDFSHPFWEAKKATGNVALCVISSDSGLCGVYNDRVLKAASNFMQKYGADKVRLITVGKKSFSFFQKSGWKMGCSFVGLHGRVSAKILEQLNDCMTKLFFANEVDEVYVAYTGFESALRCRAQVIKLLPFERPQGTSFEYLTEPDYAQLLNELLPIYISKKIRIFLLEAFTAEHSERAVAMRAATDNAKELVESLVLLRNKVRQASITKEVIEIISSAEALKG